MNNPKISICIPTYNRARHLKDCLNSIILNKPFDTKKVEICISDNGSTDDTEEVVKWAKNKIKIKYHKNTKNLGIPKNFLNVVAMASGEFAWLLGDDDLLLPDTFRRLLELIDNNSDIDFFYVNAFHLTTDYTLKYPNVFDTANLPNKMNKFSDWNVEGSLHFFDLINPNVSWDFLGGMFLSVFRRQKWATNTGVLDLNALSSEETFSHFDNTFPHLAIWARAFSKSNAYYNSDPLCVCLTGTREWAPMEPMVRSVRLLEALERLRLYGLPLKKYLYCKNFALRSFVPHVVFMYVNSETSGLKHVNLGRVFIKNWYFPYLYLSVPFYVLRKLIFLMKKFS